MPSSFIRYEVLLPARHNDGRLIERHKHNVCVDEVVAEFGGATLESDPLQGSWRFAGQQYSEPMFRLIVEVEDTPENHVWFVNWKQVLIDRFQQIDIRMTWHPIHVV